MVDQLSVLELINQFCGDWMTASNRSAKTAVAYRTDLKQFFELLPPDLPVSAIDRSMAEKWVIQLQEAQYRPASIRRKLASLRALCAYVVESGVIQESPLVNFRLRLGEDVRLTRVIPGDGVLFMLDGISTRIKLSASDSNEHVLARRDYAIIRTLGATGIRVGELCNLRCDDVVETGTCLRVLGKGARERLALLVHSEDVDCLQQYLVMREELRPDTNTLFVNSRGQSLSTEGVRRVVRLAAKAAGIQCRITPHMLRHTAATKLLERGADIRIIQRYLGHRSIRSTERYTHVSTGHLKSVVDRCHPLQRAA